MSFRSGAVLAAAFALACGPAMWGQTDDFPERVKAGCSTLEQCETLELAAKARVRECKENTVGYIRCSDARNDLDAVRELKRRIDRKHAETERAKQQADYERRDREMREQAAERERRREQARRDEQERQEAARREREARAAARVQEEHAKKVDFFRQLSVQQREARLRECYEERDDCDAFLELLLEATEAEKDRKRLIDANERFRNRPPTAASVPSSPRSIKCCDGTLSPTCVCGGSRRGCCSHHGGVCGCE